MKLRYSILAFFTCILIAFSCKDNSSSSEPDPPDPPPQGNPNLVSEDIGPDGGEVTSKDGKLTLTIPAGALGNTETITIEEITEDNFGSEFAEIVATIGVTNAYDLGPDGLSFQNPISVTINSGQTPMQTADSLGVFAEFMFTSNDGTLEMLDSLRTTFDTDNGSVTVHGQTDHFTPIMNGSALQTNNGVLFFIEDIPKMIEEGESFDAVTTIVDNVPPGDNVTVLGPALYMDESGPPITPTFDGAPAAEIEPGDGFLISFLDRFSYTCTDTGLGLYGSEMRVPVQFDLDSGPITTETFVNFVTTVECVKAPPPPINLQVSLGGNATGKVTSDLEGIDCPEDCDEEYERGTAVILTATPDEGSIFTGWSGEAPDDCGDDADCAIAVDNNRNEITATFEPEEAGSFALALGLYILSEEYGLTLPEALSLLSNPFLSGGNSTPKFKFRQILQQNEIQFGNLTGTFPVAMAGADGFVVIDLLTGEVLFDATDGSIEGPPLFGVIGLSEEPPGPGSAHAFAYFGQNGINMIDTQGECCTQQANQSSAFDAVPAGGNLYSSYAVSVAIDGINFIFYDEAQDLYKFTFFSESGIPANQFAGQVISAWMTDDGTPEDTPVLVLTREAESGVYLVKRDGSNPVRAIDNIGFDARKLRCIDDGSGTGNLVCVASIFGHDRLGLLTWDGENQPTLTDFDEVGDGPVGIDMRLLPNGNIAVVSTGFNDNTITETVVTPNGIVQSSSTRPVLEGCLSPGHAIFIQDSESLKIVGTCYDSGNYFIMESEL